MDEDCDCYVATKGKKNKMVTRSEFLEECKRKVKSSLRYEYKKIHLKDYKTFKFCPLCGKEINIERIFEEASNNE
jgi:RNA polymerase-binding transcription factor DksA